MVARRKNREESGLLLWWLIYVPSFHEVDHQVSRLDDRSPMIDRISEFTFLPIFHPRIDRGMSYS